MYDQALAINDDTVDTATALPPVAATQTPWAMYAAFEREKRRIWSGTDGVREPGAV